MRATTIALAAVLSGGCTNPLVRAESQFTEGRYPDAKAAFLSLEGESRQWGDAKRAEYALYRGLTHASLGDRGQAGRWLREARAIEEAHPGSLSHADVQRLKLGVDNAEDGASAARAAARSTPEE